MTFDNERRIVLVDRLSFADPVELQVECYRIEYDFESLVGDNLFQVGSFGLKVGCRTYLEKTILTLLNSLTTGSLLAIC